MVLDLAINDSFYRVHNGAVYKLTVASYIGWTNKSEKIYVVSESVIFLNSEHIRNYFKPVHTCDSRVRANP